METKHVQGVELVNSAVPAQCEGVPVALCGCSNNGRPDAVPLLLSRDVVRLGPTAGPAKQVPESGRGEILGKKKTHDKKIEQSK
jgi:hypothetical protein